MSRGARFEDQTSRCPACGMEFTTHPGMMLTCARLTKLARATATMRVYQRDYFRSRSKDILAQAKKAERDVDALLTDILGSDVEQF